MLNMEKLLSQGFETIAYTVFGMLIFGLGVWLMDKLTPFSIRKEIEDDQNTALGVVMGAVIIGLAIIIASGIAG
jgi:putative membrane protein